MDTDSEAIIKLEYIDELISNSYKSIYRSFHIINCRQLFRTSVEFWKPYNIDEYIDEYALFTIRIFIPCL